MSDKIEQGMLCGVLQSNFSRLSQSESRTQPCHVRMAVHVFLYQLNISRKYTAMHQFVSIV